MPLLERDKFLSMLADDLSAASGGAGRTVLISGEAGIGKTSLLEHFADEHSSVRLLWGACEPLFTPHPLGPLHDIARACGGRLGALLGDSTNRAGLFAAVLDELEVPPALSVLILEDIHWADAATLDMIRFLGRRVHRVPALMILSYRDDELDAGSSLRAILGDLPSKHVSRLPLPRLSPVAVDALAAGTQWSNVDLYAVTAGNPFFVTEVLASPDGGVPATVRDAVLGRATKLGPSAREALELTSVVPRAIESWLVEAMILPGLDAVDECVVSGLLRAEDRTLRFRHELARIAVEESIPPWRARGLHARILEALTQSVEPVALARLVHHARGAEDAEAVLRLAPQAAREATARGARREAAAHCRTALAFATRMTVAERAELLDVYADHCFELNDLPTAIPAKQAASDLFGAIGDRVRQTESLAAQAMPLVRALRNADANVVSRHAIAIAETLPAGRHLARAYATESYLRMLNRDIDEAITWGEKAIAVAERFEDTKALASAYVSLGAAMLFIDYARGCRHLKTSLDIARELADGDAQVADSYLMLGTASGELFKFVDAAQYLVEGIAFARARDLDRIAGYMEAWYALMDVYRGQWEEAGNRANAVLARERFGSTNRLMALVALGRLRTRRGDPGADAPLNEALELAKASGTLQRVAPVRCARAEAAWLAGDMARVRDEASAAFELAAAKRHPWFSGELAFWLWRAGSLHKPPPVCAEPFALQIRGRWSEAAEAWQVIGCPYEQARALADGPVPAQREALAILGSLGAGLLAERLRQGMRAAGVQTIPRGPRRTTRSNVAGLTARELQVLSLVAKGCQNAAIAASLSRSPRTIEHHLEAILAKLNVDSRHEAVAVARSRGILPQDG